ncbi:protein RRNAD1-like [Papaver somniferum]|uniref:protein RRNAD1-like n=1 Tax=Papaver somniferum TaxID=3469 RepID=UPI000E7034A0|nr:protein RRNAD1-like [Papaver somniferum]XP_026417286.1 protein RRNAD1-like [Papaver somniferum]
MGKERSCRTAGETLEWINAIHDFLKPYKPLLDSHVVSFFTDKLWESVDQQWIDCLRHEPIANLLQIPSGVIQDYWPCSLKEFVLTLGSLVFPRDPADLQRVLPDLDVIPVNNVLGQGMNLKKKHEVEVLAAVITSIAKSAGAKIVIDVGSGQGYLAQVLSFQYQLSVVAIDASSHHGTITSARAKRIKKHYAAKMRELQSGNQHLSEPQTVTCCVLSSDSLKTLSGTLSCTSIDPPDRIGLDEREDFGEQQSMSDNPNKESSLVLAGLHACGDLSVTMLRTFVESEEVKAIVSVGCCYNLLTEDEHPENTSPPCGFPLSDGLSSVGLSLGRNARDLACQSAERWRSLTEVAALQNFELHAFRAAFQMVLCKYYPKVLHTTPTIGRQGKALRRQQLMKSLQTRQAVKDSNPCIPVDAPLENHNTRSCATIKSGDVGKYCDQTFNESPRDGKTFSPTTGVDTSLDVSSNTKCPDVEYALFEKYCDSGLDRLGLQPLEEIDLFGIWMEAKPFTELVGPYWSLRAALGPVVETLLLLDRLLFFQERGNSVEAIMLPLFDPALSPRNVAIIARKI